MVTSAIGLLHFTPLDKKCPVISAKLGGKKYRWQEFPLLNIGNFRPWKYSQIWRILGSFFNVEFVNKAKANA